MTEDAHGQSKGSAARAASAACSEFVTIDRRVGSDQAAGGSMTAAATFLALVFLAGGCATVVSSHHSDELAPRAPRAFDHPIRIIDSGVPERPHEVIGSVRVRVKLSPYTGKVWPRNRILERLKEEARKLGGDALIQLACEPQSGGGDYLAPDGAYRSGSSEIWSALVIVWTEGS